MVKEYRTLGGEAEGLYRDRGSRFLSYAFPVRTLDDVMARVNALRAEHHGARHWCWGSLLGAEALDMRFDDNGEPSGSAGRPIVDALRRACITYSAIVVVRYFGGVKLGVPGLIAAYRGASEAALEGATVVVRAVEHEAWVRVDYTAHAGLMEGVARTGGRVVSESYDAKGAYLQLRWPVHLYTAAKERLETLRLAQQWQWQWERETVIE